MLTGAHADGKGMSQVTLHVYTAKSFATLTMYGKLSGSKYLWYHYLF